MSRYGSGPATIVFGPGPMTPAVRAILCANIAVFVVTFFLPSLIVGPFGLSPEATLEHGRIWQPVTYLFVHDPSGFMHIVFNMLALWMFGVDLERRWGTYGFARYYAATGVGAGLVTIGVSLLPFQATAGIYGATTIGASGAIYGLLLAWAMLFPDRRILFMFIFPLPARVAALLMGAMTFMAAVSGRTGGVAEATHLAGFVIGWFYLQGPRNLRLQLNYRLTKWRMARMRRRFDVHHGGKNDGNRRIH